MADKKFTLQFDAKMELSNIVGQLKVLQGQLEKMELPKDATKNFEKAFDKISRDMAEFEIVAARGISSLADTKNVEKAWKQITKDLDGIGATLGSLDASKVFPKEVLQNIEKANGALDKYLAKLESTKKSQEYTSKVGARDKASEKQRILQESLNKATQEQTKKEANYVAKKSQWTDQIEQSYKDEQVAVARTTKQLKDQIKVIEGLEERKKELIKEGYLTSSGSVSATKRKEIAGSEDSNEKQKLTEAEDIGAQIAAAKNIKKDYEGMAKQAREAAKANQELKKSIETAEVEFNSASKDADSFSTQLKQAEQEVDNLNTELKTLETDKAAEEWEELVSLVKEITGVDLSGSVQDINKIQETLENYQTEEIKKIPQILKDAKQNFQDTAPAVKKVEQALRDTTDEVKELSRAEQEIENLKNQIFQFFSVTNAIQLFKRTVQSAINTVKELDAVMTETAVVTDFSVGDMWEKLPEYASHANTLGASIKDVYAATTLYYQQGLQTNEAMGVGVETMKMARIANLEAGDATQYMTAALRGFNMEVNELNAERVNDVYSELAAITAADTSQIATAMSKTASIASAANMEFETTAALLAQIIETTQEAPETAGTALKTIIARFSEVKKLREEGQMTGEDEEGEAIDVNKIQGALRTVGISMDDFFAGTEGLDSVLLKLAEKWKDLDFTTQRYIATTAAGSRQQSRFIAMMSDYERTMELATAANNSAGASQQQFDKTLESMEAKLQKLKNAWDEFAMGLANNEILKFGVDLLTGILEAVNKLTGALSGGNGLIKGFVNLVTVIGALKGGSMLLGKFFGEGKIGIDFGNDQKGSISLFSGAKEKALKEGQEAGKSFNTGLQRAIQEGKEQGIGKGIGSLFGETVEELDYNNKIDYLANAYEKNQENLNFDIGEVSLAFDKGGVEAANQAILDMDGNIDDLIPKIQTFKIDFQGIGMAAVGVGTAFNLLGGLAEKLGLDGLSSALKGIGSVLAIVGSAAMALGPILTKLGVEFTTLGIKINGALVAPLSTILATIWPVVLALGALAAAIAIAYNASPEVQLKKAQEAAAQAGEAANAAAEAYDNLKSSLESIEGKEAILEDLTVGTLEWKEAVSELNNEILDLVSKYPELSQFVSSTNGILSISDEGAQKVLENQYKVQENTQAAKTAAQIKVQNAQQNADFANLDNRLKLTKMVDTYDEYSNPTRVEVIDRAATDQLAKQLASGKISTNDASLDFLKNVEGGYDEFLEYGRALLASESAIEVFTDSLLNAATVNAEIPQELKDEVVGAFDTQSIDKLISTEGVNLGTINKADKEAYAEAMGYTHISGNKYKDASGKEFKVSKNDVREQLAAINAQAALTDKVTQLGSAIGKLSGSTSSLDKAFVNMVSKADGAGLTLEDIKNLEGKFDGSYGDAIKRDDYTGEFIGFSDESLQALYSQVEHIYSPEQFYRIFSEAYSQAEERKASSEEKLAHMGMEGAFQNAKIDTGALAGITDNLYDVFLASGPDAAQALAGSIEETLNTIEDPEQAQIFADALNAIDWQNLDDVEELDAILAGMDFNYAIDGLDELKQEIITTTKATKTFNLDAIKEQVKSIEDLVKDIEDREDTERKFTQEEYDTIIKANPELASQFVATGLDEFAYVGDSMQSLIEALNQNTAALLGDYGKQVRGNAAMSEKWVALEDQRFNSEYSAMELITSVIGGSIDASLYDVREDGTRSQGAMDLINLMEQLGLGVDSGRDLNSNVYSGEDLVRILTEGYNQYYGDFGTIAQQNINNATAYTQSEETIRLSKMEGTEILNDNQATEENKKAVLDAKVALEGLQEEYDKTIKSLKDQNNALASNEKLVKASIVDAKNYEDKLTELAEAYDENKDALVGTNKGTREYRKALANITKAAKEAFGDNITEDFIENNLDLFEDWYKGAEGSADRLRSALVDSLIEASIGTESEVSRIRNIVSGLDGLNFDIYGHADATQLFNELAAVMGSAEEAARAMEVLGYSVTWEETGVKRMLILDPESPTGKRMVDIPEYKAVVTDGLGNRAGANRSSYGGNKGGGGGGGGGGSEPKKWENPYDEFYNTVELLNEELRTREKLERRYQKLLDNTNTKASDLVKNVREQLDSLQLELKTRQELLAGRERQMADIEREYSDLSDYAFYNEEKQVIEIDWTKIEALDGSTDEELTSRIEEYIGKLEEQQDLIEEEQDSIAEIEDAVKEIREQGKDEYFDLEGQIKEALEKARQEEIDKLSEINDSINDTNARLLDAMQSSIDKYRQDRENERTEEELSDKQRRLAYLQQDTSGANDLEILQLQEEIEQGQEDYTDTLIDQKINELQEQNDKAAEQRQQQIDLLQAQLDQYLESGEVWQDVYALMDEGINADGGLIRGSDLEALLQDSANFKGMSELGKVKWLEELENNLAEALKWLQVGNSTKALLDSGELKKGQKVTFTTSDGKKVTGTLNEDGSITTKDGKTYKDVYKNYDGTYVTKEKFQEPDPPKPSKPKEPEPEAPKLDTNTKRGVSAAIWNGNYGWGNDPYRSERLKEVFGENDIQENYVEKYVMSGYTGKISDYSYANMKKKFKKFKTGGLADFTGPAWLDGTKSKPEYILNADQTKSFFQLVDVLGSLKSGANQSSQITGDSIYDVDINVESIGSDYDVEQLASTIKRMINDDARYRNNNAINLQR